MVEAVVFAAAVGEAAFAGPELAADLVQDEPGFLGDLASRGVLELLAGVLAAAGEFPPVVVGLVGVAGVDEQDFVVAVEEQTRAPTRRTGSLATVIR